MCQKWFFIDRLVPGERRWTNPLKQIWVNWKSNVNVAKKQMRELSDPEPSSANWQMKPIHHRSGSSPSAAVLCVSPDFSCISVIPLHFRHVKPHKNISPLAAASPTLQQTNRKLLLSSLNQLHKHSLSYLCCFPIVELFSKFVRLCVFASLLLLCLSVNGFTFYVPN